MSQGDPENGVGQGSRARRGRAIARGVADRLHLAAAPAFALMALLTAVQEAGADRMRCMGMSGASVLDSMSLMYLLMSAVHAAPWIRLAARRACSGRRRPASAAGRSGLPGR
jgi:hypothetical protein